MTDYRIQKIIPRRELVSQVGGEKVLGIPLVKRERKEQRGSLGSLSGRGVEVPTAYCLLRPLRGPGATSLVGGVSSRRKHFCKDTHTNDNDVA